MSATPEELPPVRIVEHVDLDIVGSLHDTTRLQAELIYDPADPFAATMAFNLGSQKTRWTFGRELLIDGLYEPAGDGDVLVWPCLGSTGNAVVIIERSAADGEVLLPLGSRAVRLFVTRMLQAVPVGEEGGLIDVESALQRMLRG